MIYRGRVRNGVIVLDESIQLAEGTAVTVQPEEESHRAGASDDPLYRMADLAAPTGISDLSVNIDHYLYGHPRTTDADE